MNYTQANRLIAVSTPAGEDVLLLTSFAGREAISELFCFQLEMLSTNESLDLDSLIGKNATARVNLADGTSRYANGYFSSFSQSRRENRFATFSAEIVPWLWFLTQTRHSRIFQNKQVPDILQQVFTEAGFHDFELRLYGSFLHRDFCVQYRESDFDFVSRLMEEEGIFYFFEHENGKHTLVLGNASDAHKPCPGQAQARLEISAGGQRGEDVVQEWNIHRRFRPGKFALNDYNFETPSADLSTTVAVSAFEVYDYPGGYSKQSDGDSLVDVRVQESAAQRKWISGSSDCRAFGSGYKFQLLDHYRKDQNTWYVIHSVTHSARQGATFTTQPGAGSDPYYSNSFHCIGLEAPFRPQRRTPKPTIKGSQTAFVVGPQGEEIFTDKYGRVKVQFHWDRQGQSDENSSCWLRVVQSVAGKQWGYFSLPRVGQEVIVEFLEGDPDRPIVTGSVYNAEQMPPYELPKERTKTTFKSRSSPGGGGFNELRFDDAKGREQIFLHGERDLEIRVKKDVVETINGEKHLTLDGNCFEKMKQDRNLEVTGDDKQKIKGSLSVNVDSQAHLKSGESYAVEAGTDVHIKAGMNLVLEASMSLTLKVGGNFVNIGPSGVAISGTMILLNSGGAAGSGAGASPDPPKSPREAINAIAGEMVRRMAKPPIKPQAYSPAATVMKQAYQSGTPFCEVCARIAAEHAQSGNTA